MSGRAGPNGNIRPYALGQKPREQFLGALKAIAPIIVVPLAALIVGSWALAWMLGSIGKPATAPQKFELRCTPQTPAAPAASQPPLAYETSCSMSAPAPAGQPGAAGYPWTALNSLTQLLAGTAAAAFFAWKLWTGYHSGNLTVKLEAHRHRLRPDDPNDILLARLIFEKGEREAHEVTKVRLSAKPLLAGSLASDKPLWCPVPLQFSNAVDMADESPDTARWFDDLTVCEGGDPSVRRYVRVNPGESAAFEYAFAVPRDQLIKLDVLVEAKAGYLHFIYDDTITGYWRASTVSTPLPEEKVNRSTGMGPGGGAEACLSG